MLDYSAHEQKPKEVEVARKKKSPRKAFTGDFERELPKGKVEPYRLWFEYLKFALQEPAHKVDLALYEPWHDVLTRDFDEWWKEHWKPLFTIPASVSLLTTHDEIVSSAGRDDVIVIRVSRSGGKDRVEKDIKKLLTGILKKQSSPNRNEPAFSVSSKRSMNYPSLRAMLKLLQLMRVHKYVEEATEAYCRWAYAWNAERQKKDWNKPDIFVPGPLTTFLREIEEHRKVQAGSVRRTKQSPQYNNAKNDVSRLVRKAQKILRNVERGKFPGEY
jgi:hypothetical protein